VPGVEAHGMAWHGGSHAKMLPLGLHATVQQVMAHLQGHAIRVGGRMERIAAFAVANVACRCMNALHGPGCTLQRCEDSGVTLAPPSASRPRGTLLPRPAGGLFRYCAIDWQMALPGSVVTQCHLLRPNMRTCPPVHVCIAGERLLCRHRLLGRGHHPAMGQRYRWTQSMQ
jgi:hypothetical protein